MKIKQTFGERAFDVFNCVFLGLLCFTFIYPFWYLFAVSIADAEKQAMSAIYFLPSYFSLDSYQNVLSSIYVWYGFLWSIIRTVLGTVIAVLFSYHYAYALSKRYLPNRGFWTTILVITMFFGGGLVPEYLLVRNLGLRNTIWALVLPGAISAYNITIMRNFLMAMPESLEESARIDGAKDLTILYRIIFPLSMPIIATVGLWTAVGHWNAWFDSMIYITDPERQVLQVTLRRIVLEGTNQLVAMYGEDVTAKQTSETIKAAVTMVTALPILMV
ncbi:MAG: carbohydrate ABC transporter permease, partial [Clostridia bacterium]|nr:carbohydrate ABC transporter permease [Clostridia bacterium]